MAQVGHRFREVLQYASALGYAGGFPNFHEADYGAGTVYGTIFFRSSAIEWRDVPRAEYHADDTENVAAMIRGANEWAARNGLAGAIPTFYAGASAQGVVYGTNVIRPGVSEFRDVLIDDLDVGDDMSDEPRLMRAVDDYAVRNGFGAGFPTFRKATTPQGVVFGAVLIRREHVVRRDVPAELLAQYSRPQQRWAVVFCNPSDVPPAANSRQRWVDFFTASGFGTGNALEYWRDMSYGQYWLNVEFFGFFDIGRTRAQVRALDNAGKGQRGAVFGWGRDAATANGIDLSRFDHTIVLMNLSCDHGDVGNGNVVLGYEDTRELEPTFIMHEMGHALGLHDSHNEVIGQYHDQYDIMSAMTNVQSYWVNGRRFGPGLNVESRRDRGWVHPSRIWSPTRAGETVRLVAAHRPDLDGALLIRFEAASRSDPRVASVYTLELRANVGWDRGIASPRVVVHEVLKDGTIRLLTSGAGGVTNEGELPVGGEFVPALPGVIARLESLDPDGSAATLRVWHTVDGWRGVRIQHVEWNPPGPDLEGESVVLQNDSSVPVNLHGWTLRDEQGATYTFPAYTLVPGATVNIWTRSGADDAQNLYWNRTAAVWNNSGDTATLSSPTARVHRFAYRA